jgi:iron complex transport system substrate-binding protein
MTILCAALAALAVSGCEATDTDDPPENVRSLKVQHALGQTRVPGEADRPVALYPSELDSAVALGAGPAGATTLDGRDAFPRYLGEATGSVEPVGPVARPDLERIATLEPDVILAGKQSHERLYPKLKQVAPTVVLDEKVDWKPNLRQDGEALGRSDQAERLLIDYDRRAARVRRLLSGRATPQLPAEARRGLSRPFIASVLDDVGLPHPRPGDDRLSGARPGPNDHWTLGIGYLAALRVLGDLERLAGASDQ